MIRRVGRGSEQSRDILALSHEHTKSREGDRIEGDRIKREERSREQRSRADL